MRGNFEGEIRLRSRRTRAPRREEDLSRGRATSRKTVLVWRQRAPDAGVRITGQSGVVVHVPAPLRAAGLGQGEWRSFSPASVGRVVGRGDVQAQADLLSAGQTF